MKQTAKDHILGFLTENISYKLIALFIALILWLTILGRRDFVSSYVLDVELITNPQYQIVGQTAEQIELRVAGPRQALKKLAESHSLSLLTLSVPEHREGLIDVPVAIEQIEIPVGLRIISTKPSIIRVELRKKEIPEVHGQEK